MERELRFVEANRLRFGVLESGSGPLVLLVHGFPDTAHSWDRVRPALAAAGLRVVAPFTRGYAPTEVPKAEAFDSNTLGRDLIELVRSLGESSAMVVGHDWGASAAYSAAAIAPEAVRKLVTVAIPHPAAIVPTPRMIWSLRHFFTLRRPSTVDWIGDGNFAYVDELVQRWSPTWKVPLGETDAVKEIFRRRECLDAALGYYRAARPRLPSSHRLKISVPTASFAGDDDMMPLTAYERARVRFTGPYEVVRMPGGHFMHREHPERFIEELLRVLGR